ncbi:MAG: PKD domain-containing protein [Bacteroidales bacterium]|nr:PKD domain-containing protein [Bacteroidales bacterium]
MKSFILLLAVFCVFVDNAFCQVKNYNNWMLRDGAIVNFAGEIGTVSYKDDVEDIHSCISDDDGNLKFYIDSHNIYDMDGNVIYTLSSLPYYTVAVKDPLLQNSYYFLMINWRKSLRVIHIMDNGNNDYSVNSYYVDNDLYGPYFGVYIYNDNIYTVSYRHKSVDLIWHCIKSDNAIALNTIEIPNKLSYDPFSTSFHINNDLTKLYINGFDQMYIVDLDVVGNIFGNVSVLPWGFDAFEFSECGDYIYIVERVEEGGKIMRCHEEDFMNPERYEILMKDFDTPGNYTSDIKLAVDGNLYFLKGDNTSLSVITDTDGDCNILLNEIPLTNDNVHRYLPQMPRFQSSFRLTEECYNVKTDYVGYPYSSISWDFGDGYVVDGVDNPTHTYSIPGKYKVSMTVFFKDGSSRTISKSIETEGRSKPTIKFR